MAGALVGALSGPLTGAFGAGGAWLIGLGAAVLDNTVLMPALIGKGKQAGLPPRLQDVPVGSNEAGAPRIWAIGSRVRVPTHILFQKEKIREAISTTHKEGTTVEQRQVMIDCLISLNDRKTVELTQLIGNGKLLVWESRNLIRITTHEMTAAVSGSDIVITMANTLVPNPTERFEVGDVVKLYGWAMTAGASINGSFWGVKAITGHTSTPGTITLEPAQGQVVTSVAANGGSAFTPAHIERVDDALVGDPDTMGTGSVETGPYPPGYGSSTLKVVALRFGSGVVAANVFNVGETVKMTNVWAKNATGSVQFQIPSNIHCYIVRVDQDAVYLFPYAGAAPNPGATWPGGFVDEIFFNSGPSNWPRVEYVTPQTLAGSFFPDGFVPKDHYHDGSEDQGEDAILVAAKGPGNVPAYRGVAYQAIDDFKVTAFGGQLPYALEAIIRPDAAMTWAQAIYEVLRRAAVPHSAINTEGVSLEPFLGYFIRGFVPTATSIQPLLLAKQIVGQERDGTICLFQIENADVTQIQNGPQFSDLGAHIYGEARQDDKILTEDGAVEDLPTFIGVRHQDPDNVFADGYQPFGLRHPTGPREENRQELDLSTLVLSRKDAKNLGATTLRRAHVNNRKYTWQLTACYLDQLENDVQTVTDDDGNIITDRVAQRTVGANYLVNCVGLREDLNLAVQGSPVQSAAGAAPPTIIMPAVFDALVLDCSSVADDENNEPMLRFACCAQPGSHWAGGRMFETLDGSTWSPINILSAQSVMGRLTEPTPAVAGPSETHTSSTVTFYSAPVDVEFTHEGVHGINACSQAEALGGRNLCAIVDPTTGEVELAAFTQVTQIAPRTYTLDGWLRGLRGTKASVRPTGSRLVILGPSNEYPSSTRRYPGLSQPASLAFKFVPVGLGLEDVSAISIVATWRNCRPLPIRRLDKSIGPSPFSVRLTTEHWTKEHLPVGALGPYAMDEPFEGYKFSIYNPAGTAVRRIKWLLATPASGTTTLRDKFIDYTPAEQTADGYTPGAATTFVVDVQQVGFLGQISGLSDSNKRTV